MSDWLLIKTKQKQEARAFEHLGRQGFNLYCPWLKPATEPLFPGYLFIAMNSESLPWEKIRYTRGVSYLVRFGLKPAFVPGWLIEQIKIRENQATKQKAEYKTGDSVKIKNGPFSAVDAVFCYRTAEQRCVVLLKWLNELKEVSLPFSMITKI